LIAGRDFTAGDRDGSPRVVIINASLARAQFGNESPLGRHLVLHEDKQATRLEVIGVVRNATYETLQEARGTRRSDALRCARSDGHGDIQGWMSPVGAVPSVVSTSKVGCPRH
jgi:hypothetical protein